MGEYTGKGWTCPHCFGHIEWEQTPYGRYEQERDTLAAENRWLREKVAATAGWLASYADSARMQFEMPDIDSVILDLEAALQTPEQGERDG